MKTMTNETEFERLVYSPTSDATSESDKLSESRGGRNIRKGRNSIKHEKSDAPRRSQRISMINKIKIESVSDSEQNDITMKLKKSDVKSTDLPYSDKSIRIGKILGATEINDELKFVFKWTDEDKLSIVSSAEAKMKYPYEVMEFYESRMQWETDDEGVDDDDKTDNYKRPLKH
ncbi:chromobox protein homolog 5-like [Contarinia nasturtii]|uniref:chromobox protein homolog 5-like n=1 Tax=Contarinia nasturtii TaxID=265458 RepID=UPI0012D45FF9|nr:chromobox protein homolog 5-like [Contarinia nasturtii]